MITFIISKDDITKTFECSMEDSIISLKKKIIQEFNLSTDYVDLEFILERPIRSLGKFNLESGIIPRTLDSYKFDRYGLDDKIVNATYHIVSDYQHKKYERTFKHVNLSQKYKVEREMVEETNTFDINSESDFPSLG